VTGVRIVVVGAARPNFPKVWAVLRGLAAADVDVDVCFVHAGQHYDDALSQQVLDDLGLPEPDLRLATGSGTAGEQTAAVVVAFERALADLHPDAVVVVGDVNATLSCALVAARSPALLAHVEAGLRSGDREMPEELNRIATDHLSDVLYAPSPAAVDQLATEGLGDRAVMAGNTMVDALDHVLPAARRHVPPRPGPFGLITLHRPANVDEDHTLDVVLDQLVELSQDLPLVLPAHPRAAERLRSRARPPAFEVVAPMGYRDFLGTLDQAALVLTDSGGVQEEATVLGVPCLTLRTTTERPVTVDEGTNHLIDPATGAVVAAARAALQEPRRPHRPAGWDGKAGLRIAEHLVDLLASG